MFDIEKSKALAHGLTSIIRLCVVSMFSFVMCWSAYASSRCSTDAETSTYRGELKVVRLSGSIVIWQNGWTMVTAYLPPPPNARI